MMSASQRANGAVDRPDLELRNPSGEADSGWFLLNSRWNDVVWVFKPTNLVEETRDLRIRWDIALSDGKRLTDGAHAEILESSRRFIALLRTSSLASNARNSASTASGYFYNLRVLLIWMGQAGFGRFSHLDAAAVLEFQQSLRRRKGHSGKALSSATMQRYHHLFAYLYRFRGEIGDGLDFDPFPGKRSGQIARKQGRAASRLPYTPEPVATVLIEGAIKIASGVDDIMLAMETYQLATSSAKERGCGQDACTNAANKALRELASLAKAVPICSVRELTEHIDMLYAACFILLAYLVGPRASEILHLRAGCVHVRDDGIGGPVTIIKGAIFKRQAEYFGREHEWVAPPMAIKAIGILELLSSKHRQQARSDFLWLRRGKVNGALEWQAQSEGILAIMSTQRSGICCAGSQSG